MIGLDFILVPLSDVMFKRPYSHFGAFFWPNGHLCPENSVVRRWSTGLTILVPAKWTVSQFMFKRTFDPFLKAKTQS